MPSDTFGYTGSRQSWTVPSHVDEVTVKAYGAGGAGGSGFFSGGGANGGYAEGTDIPVSGGDTLYIYVGEGVGGETGGWPDGGDGNSASASEGNNSVSASSGGGGGAAKVRLNGDTPSDSIVVAGGGAGGGSASIGSDQSIDTNGGADSTGGNGGGGDGCAGDTEVTGVTGGDASGGCTGTQSGETGATGASQSDSGGDYDQVAAAAGGGGGGGYAGGGAGGASADAFSESYAAGGAGGGGGSSYITSSATTSTDTEGGGNSGNGEVVIVYAPQAPTNLSVDSTGLTTVDLSWTDNSDGEDEFRVYRAESSGATTSDYTQIATVSSSSEGSTGDEYTYTDSGLPNGEKYYYRVTAVDTDNGGESPVSGESSGQTILPGPSGLQLSNATADSIDVSWTDNIDGENGYRVYTSTDRGDTWTNVSGDLAAGTTSYTVQNLKNGELYYIGIKTFTEHAERWEVVAQIGETHTIPDGETENQRSPARVDGTVAVQGRLEVQE